MTKPSRVSSQERPAGPLAGVRVLDLSRVLAGPFCSMILADLGADVIKVEHPEEGDQTRFVPPLHGGESHYFLAINRNKRDIAVDMKTPEGREVILDLAERSDVVLQNFRPGVMERLGLDTASLRDRNPRLVICSISGFGQTGSMRDQPAFDLVTQALSGAMSINGEPAGPPTKLGIPLGDVGGGMWAAIGILAGVLHARSSGQGTELDISMLEGLISQLGYLGQLYLTMGESPGQVGSSHHSVVPYGRFEAADGHLVIAPHVGAFWEKLCHAIGRPDLLVNPLYRDMESRKQNRASLEALLSDIFKTRSRAEWSKILVEHDVPNASVNSVEEAIEMLVHQERGFIKSFEHPTAGTVRVIGSPLQFGDEFDQPMRAPPLLGQHTDEVLTELGYAQKDIDALRRKGLLYQSPPTDAPSTPVGRTA